jgi:hypothetical protein
MANHPCTCGEVFISSATPEVEINGTYHRAGDPCYVLGSAAAALAAPPVPTRQGLEYITFVRIPFTVQAVWITAENIADVAKYVGDLEHRDDGTPFILVDPRKVPSVEKVYPGYAMTRLGDNVRCYSRKVFLDQFTEQTVDIKPWVDFMQTVNDG